MANTNRQEHCNGIRADKMTSWFIELAELVKSASSMNHDVSFQPLNDLLAAFICETPERCHRSV
jgi:hypothetical protein